MPFFLFFWTDEIIAHLAEHGVTIEESEEIVSNCDPDEVEISHSTDRLIAFGETSSGRLLACVYEEIDETTILPVTAYINQQTTHET